MQHKFFSELIVGLPIRPDFTLASKIDDIDLPFSNMKFIKKDINNLFLKIFQDFMDEYKSKNESFKNFEILNDSTMSMLVKMGKTYELKLKKIKVECSLPINQINFDFDDRILTNDFIDEIDRMHLLMCLAVGASIRKTIHQIENESGIEVLQSKFVYDQIFEFWTKYAKRDFCYFGDIELDDTVNIEDREIELCMLKFFFNAFKYAYIDLEKFDAQQKTFILNTINDKSNFRWYVIFGFWLIKRFEENHVNTLDFLYSDYAKVKQIMEEILP
jgi:hypothetical protein